MIASHTSRTHADDESVTVVSGVDVDVVAVSLVNCRSVDSTSRCIDDSKSPNTTCDCGRQVHVSTSSTLFTTDQLPADDDDNDDNNDDVVDDVVAGDVSSVSVKQQNSVIGINRHGN